MIRPGSPVTPCSWNSSGEGLIWGVRDEIRELVSVMEKGQPRRKEQVTDPGVNDKRLLVTESEFASVLQRAERETNTLSAIIRQAWDTGNWRVLTKKQATIATNAHMEVLVNAGAGLAGAALVAIVQIYIHHSMLREERAKLQSDYALETQRLASEYKRINELKQEADSQVRIKIAEHLDQHDADVGKAIEKNPKAFRKVSIYNTCGQQASIAIGFRAVDGKFEVSGWYDLPPGKTGPVLTTDQDAFYGHLSVWGSTNQRDGTIIPLEVRIGRPFRYLRDGFYLEELNSLTGTQVSFQKVPLPPEKGDVVVNWPCR